MLVAIIVLLILVAAYALCSACYWAADAIWGFSVSVDDVAFKISAIVYVLLMVYGCGVLVCAAVALRGGGM